MLNRFKEMWDRLKNQPSPSHDPADLPPRSIRDIIWLIVVDGLQTAEQGWDWFWGIPLNIMYIALNGVGIMLISPFLIGGLLIGLIKNVFWGSNTK